MNLEDEETEGGNSKGWKLNLIIGVCALILFASFYPNMKKIF